MYTQLTLYRTPVKLEQISRVSSYQYAGKISTKFSQYSKISPVRKLFDYQALNTVDITTLEDEKSKLNAYQKVTQTYVSLDPHASITSDFARASHFNH